MPTFMLTFSFSPESAKALLAKPNDRRQVAKDAMQTVGANLKEYYFSLGKSDAIVIFEAPDAISAASVSMALGASGAVMSAETTALLTMEEAVEAMKKAGQTAKAYKPPAT